MKSTMKLLLVVVLFCGTALADGEMGSGGYAPCTPNCPPPPPCEEELCLAPPAGGPAKESETVLIYLTKFVISMLK